MSRKSVSEATIKRKISSIRKLLGWHWENDEGVEKEQPIVVNNYPSTVPGVIMLAVVILMIIQVLTKEKIESPWTDVIASDKDRQIALSSEAQPLGNADGLEETKVTVTLEDSTADDEAGVDEATLLLAASKEATGEEKYVELETQLEKDAYGFGQIEKRKNEVLVHHPTITPYSYIYITPTSSTENQTIYIGEQGVGYFTARIDQALETEVGFNWWSINH